MVALGEGEFIVDGAAVVLLQVDLAIAIVGAPLGDDDVAQAVNPAGTHPVHRACVAQLPRALLVPRPYRMESIVLIHFSNVH